MLRERLHRKRFLIVMDDVWNAKAWKVLSASLPKDDITGSRILLTTRSEGVAYGVADLQPLGEEESWILLQKKISQQESCPPKLKELGMQISKKTKRIPFAIILDLPDCLRHCFLYFGALPQDDEILTSKLIRDNAGLEKIDSDVVTVSEWLDRIESQRNSRSFTPETLLPMNNPPRPLHNATSQAPNSSQNREQDRPLPPQVDQVQQGGLGIQFPPIQAPQANLDVTKSSFSTKTSHSKNRTSKKRNMSWLDVDGVVVSLDKVVVVLLTFITTFTLAKTEIQHQKEPWPCNFLDIMETILALLDALSRGLARANTVLEKINSDVVTVSEWLDRIESQRNSRAFTPETLLPMTNRPRPPHNATSQALKSLKTDNKIDHFPAS
ncbi:hypothetical protein FXO37_13879 [Capsicum annuum]|nr:hypothetical protein FXO37_13879 [Capsicum annuum]